MTGWQRRELHVPEMHPSARGHFPGRPVVPGALLLDEAAQAVAANGPFCFRTVKFLAPVSHGVPLELRWQSREDKVVRFEIRRPDTGEPIVAGTVETGE